MSRKPIANVRCPHCDYAYSKQNTSCATPEGYQRTRKCLSEMCGKGFTTYEVLSRDLTLIRQIRRWMEKDK